MSNQDSTYSAIAFDVWSPNPNLAQAKPDPALCAASVYRPPSWFSCQCSRKGVLEYGGHRWCKLHHPPAELAKREAKHAKWAAERKRQDDLWTLGKQKDAALEAIKQIAAGHNDPRALAQEVLAMTNPSPSSSSA
jgi:hypothetical protein